MEPLLDPEDHLLEQHLLRAGRDVDMSADLRMKTIAAVGAAGAGLALVGVSKLGAFSWLAARGWPYALGVVGISGVAALAVLNEPEAPSHPKVAQAALTTDRVAQSQANETAPTAKEQAPIPEIPAATHPEAEALPQKLTVKRKKSTGLLGEELQHLSRASQSLASGNPGVALQQLTMYRQEFPNPRLGLEAETLHIQALFQSGQTALAESRARNFVTRHPSSPLIARIKKYTR